MTQNASTMVRPCWSIAPYFIVDDVVATANFYRDKLGFNYERFWGEPPSFCTVKRGGEAWDAYVWVEDAGSLYTEFRSKGVKIVREICDQPYGNRDFDVEDCNGYRLCFGHDIEE